MIAKHCPSLVISVFQLLLIDQMFVNVVDEGLVTPLGVIWVSLVELRDLFLEFCGIHHLG